jgi:hypothetical protein
MQLPDEHAETFLSAMNDNELSPADRAQKLVDLQSTLMQSAATSFEEASTQLWMDTQTEWKGQIEALPEIGGKALPATLATIKQGLLNVGATDATFQALDITGAGNHPEMVRVLHALTKGIVEGNNVSGDPPTTKLSAADTLYGASS